MTQINIKTFKKILVANRGEIAIRVFRACTELGIKTVAIYSEEDRLHLHRYKADEAYLVGRGLTPVGAYLNSAEIIKCATDRGVDAIHPGYGFLSENPEFSKACGEAGIAFIGPTPEILEALGDKVAARHLAVQAGVPVIPGTEEAVETEQDALLFAKKHGYPLLVKAARGGGGRGMSIVKCKEELVGALQRSRSEAQASFGSPRVFLEKYLESPRHIEVQILGDHYGHLVHLFERDCSIQRRHQKVVEIAPARDLSPKQRESLYRDALAIGKEVNYKNAGTVEFLLDQEGHHYFIEVNPRIQVEHTITEVITGRDIVQAQIRIAEGYPLEDEKIRIEGQENIKKSGYAIQLRLTTEDPENNFAPDTGKITTFRAGEGFGIRLDAGSGFDGAIISPHYDSLLIKVISWSLDFDQAVKKGLRAIREFRIRGVKTNIPFLEKVLENPDFLDGKIDTRFIEKHPELFIFNPKKNRGNKLLSYLAHLNVNGFPGIDPGLIPVKRQIARLPGGTIPEYSDPTPFEIFSERGAKGLADWVADQKPLLFTDTTFRDAHQSLIATRMRSFDLYRIARATSAWTKPYFSNELWGGATFDVAYRFLHEDPWERLRVLRKLIPGSLFQMLLRAGNAVGYTNYPDNVVERFIQAAARNGIDVFRIFDSLNWVESLKPCIDMVLQTGKICEASICYSGDISDNSRVKFTLEYYLKIARELEQSGTHILAIKDMAGLLKPEAARILITELKNALRIPIHLHTHDTSGNGVATLLAAAGAGVDIVDAALSSMSGITSQPSLNALIEGLRFTPRQSNLEVKNLQKLSDYWETTRELYAPFECGLKAGTADVYLHEIPGGQYSNYRPQAIGLGLGDKWEEVKGMYRTVNDMLGEIIKVTPSSKAVGDMALFMVQNNLTPQEVIEKGSSLAFPDSFVTLLKGMMGQPPGGFPKELQTAILKGATPVTCRPGDLLEDFHFSGAKEKLTQKYQREFSEEELISYSLYPKVFLDYCDFVEEFGDVSVLDTATFFYGLAPSEERGITIQEGKTLIVKLITVGELKKEGTREVIFEFNGVRRSIIVPDRKSGIEVLVAEKANSEIPGHVGAPMAGKVVEMHVALGDKISAGDKLVSTEAMKMLNHIVAPCGGTVERVLFQVGGDVRPGDLICSITPD